MNPAGQNRNAECCVRKSDSGIKFENCRYGESRLHSEPEAPGFPRKCELSDGYFDTLQRTTAPSTVPHDCNPSKRRPTTPILNSQDRARFPIGAKEQFSMATIAPTTTCAAQIPDGERARGLVSPLGSSTFGPRANTDHGRTVKSPSCARQLLYRGNVQDRDGRRADRRISSPCPTVCHPVGLA